MTFCDLRRLKLGAHNMQNKTMKLLIPRFSPALLSLPMAVTQQSAKCGAAQPVRHRRAETTRVLGGRLGLNPGPTRRLATHCTWRQPPSERIMDGCVVQENFSNEATNYRGTSLSIFDTTVGKWKQTWVDNGGAYLDFVGEFKDGQMILQREAVGKNGVKSLQRMVWKNITANEFDWSWEASQDNGKTWQVKWPIRYKRKS